MHQHPNHILKLERRKKYKQREREDKNHNLKIKITWNEISEKYIRKETKKNCCGTDTPLFKTFFACKRHFDPIKLSLITFTYLGYRCYLIKIERFINLSLVFSIIK